MDWLSNTKGRVIAAAAMMMATLAVVAPAHAAPAPTGVTLEDGGDGVIDSSEASAVVVSGAWTGAVPDVDRVRVRIVADAGCSPAATPQVTATEVVVPTATAGTFAIPLDVSGFPDGDLCALARVRDTTPSWSPWVAGTTSVLTQNSGVPTILSPSTGDEVGVKVKNNGDRYFTVGGVGTQVGATIRLYEINEGLIGVATVASTFTWNIDVVLPTDTYTIWATEDDTLSNPEGGSSNIVVFDLDADLPVATVTWPPNDTIFLPGEPVIIEGLANDTNGQSYAGLLAVEANIHDPLLIEPRVLPGQAPGNTLGVLEIGDIIHQENVICWEKADPNTACPLTGVSVASWAYDASWLPAGTYTIQFLAHDNVGNEAIQPAVIRFTKLG